MRSGEHLAGRIHRLEQGFTLLAVLAAMFLLALTTQQVMVVLSQQAQREREAELLDIGGEFVRAIGSYYERSPGATKDWPPTLEALTNDRRFVTLQRHLRRVYPDPITRSYDWGIVPAPGGGVAGVYSKSDAQPIRAVGAELNDLGLVPAQRYRDWKFLYTPGAVNASAGARP